MHCLPLWPLCNSATCCLTHWTVFSVLDPARAFDLNPLRHLAVVNQFCQHFGEPNCRRNLVYLVTFLVQRMTFSHFAFSFRQNASGQAQDQNFDSRDICCGCRTGRVEGRWQQCRQNMNGRGSTIDEHTIRISFCD